MAITLNANILSGLTWTQKSTTGVTTLTDAGSLQIDGDIQDGTGNNQGNLLWHDIRTLGSGSGETLDLHALTKTMFNDTFDISFSGGWVKCLTVNNTTSGDIEINLNTGILPNPFNAILKGASGRIPIPALSSTTFSNVRTGWPVSATQRNIYIYDVSGSGCTYEIAVLGVTGVL